MWMTTPSWSSGSLGSFLYSSSVYSYHLFLISSDSVGSLPFLFFIVSILSRNISLISPTFLKRLLVFPILVFSSISLHCSLKKAFLSLLALLWKSACSWYLFPFLPCLLLFFFPQLFVKPPQATTWNACLHFIFFGVVLVTASCTMSLTFSIHSSSGTLSTTSNPLNLFITSTI